MLGTLPPSYFAKRISSILKPYSSHLEQLLPAICLTPVLKAGQVADADPILLFPFSTFGTTYQLAAMLA